jgi:hypothetical protein
MKKSITKLGVKPPERFIIYIITDNYFKISKKKLGRKSTGA